MTSRFVKFKPTRGQYIFIGCLILSFFFWTLNKLSQTYVVQRTYPVSYTKIKDNQVFLNKPPKELDLEIQGYGFSLLIDQYRDKKDSIKIDLSKLPLKTYGNKSFAYSSPNALLFSANRKISRNVKVLKILSDTLFFRFDLRGEKVVPIKSNITARVPAGFAIRDSNSLSPNSTKISGPKSIIDSIL
ncbi:MAG: hypothetical protein MRY83_10750, partial [Flavobacteriales bacterium]|nr:hypothetical protein [Flavobacteriales bacterium]